jgi:hypothetical protein
VAANNKIYILRNKEEKARKDLRRVFIFGILEIIFSGL